MSTQFNIGKVDKMVIILAPSNAPANSKASDELQKLTKLALGKGIPEEKSKSIPSVAEGGVKKNEQEENGHSATTVMEAAGTPAEYPSKESVKTDLINEAVLEEKRADCQVVLGTISHYICTNNLTGLLTMRLFGNGLDNVLCNMIDDGINVICDRMGNCSGKINYITRLVMFDWLRANLHKVELWQLIDKSTKDVYQFILDKMNSHSTDTRSKKKHRTWY